MRPPGSGVMASPSATALTLLVLPVLYVVVFRAPSPGSASCGCPDRNPGQTSLRQGDGPAARGEERGTWSG